MTSATQDELELVLDGGEVPLRFVQDGRGILLLGHDANTDWPVLLLRAGVARVRLDGEEHDYQVELVADAGDRREGIEALRQKYGVDRFQRWFPTPGRLLRLTPGERGGSDRSPYLRWVSSEFDAIAGEYEGRLEANPVERCSRQISIALLRDRLADCHRLLEIGPGVGIETIPLLRDGHAITAVDIAPAMLRNLTERARAAGVVENLRTVHLSAGELDRLGTGEGTTRFDGAYSTFGALNCEPNLAAVARQAARLLPPGAPFILGVFNRMNITELLMSLMSPNRRRAINRGDLFVKVGQSRFAVDYVPRSVSEVRATFSPDFRFERVQGFPVLLPPPDRAARWRQLLENVPALLELDGRMGRSRWFAPLAEHLWITLVRSG